ncbi:MAG: hypothetical protein WCG99_01975 [Candidatus Berkelbacteria bacterium]
MWVLTIILAVIAAVLQSTIIPSLTVFGGLVDLILIVVLIYLFYSSVSNAGIFLLVASIVISVLSGIHLIYIILPNFVVMLVYVLLSSRRIISRPSVIFSIFLFFLACVFAGLVKMLEVNIFSFSTLVPILFSSLIGALAGGILYYFCNKIYYFFNPQISREKVRISYL